MTAPQNPDDTSVTAPQNPDDTSVTAPQNPDDASVTEAQKPDDTTLQFHVSHTPDRHVDVLRDILLGLLADDVSLEPRDILVLCPRLDEYRDWLDAAFCPPTGPIDWTHPAHGLRLTLSGAWIVAANPVLDLLGDLLDLTGSRATASQLLAICANPGVMARFGWDAAALERLTDLIRASGLRWGLSAARRRPFGLEAYAENTWQAGLARLALGVAARPDELRPVGTALPLETVEADQIPLVGALLELTGRLRRILDEWAGPADAPTWLERARTALDLLIELTPDQQGQRAEALAALADLAAAGSIAPLLSAADIAVWLDAARSGRRGRERLLAGDLTVCAPQELRLVPHRVICWLGLDAESFPRRLEPDGDDLLTQRDGWGQGVNPTWLDRQAFIDSVLDARERFIVIYRGHDAASNAPVMPPAPVRDLMELVGQVHGRATLDRLVHDHSLQRFGAGASDVTFDPAGGSGLTFDPAGGTDTTPDPPRPSNTTPGPAPQSDTTPDPDRRADVTPDTAPWKLGHAHASDRLVEPPPVDSTASDPVVLTLDALAAALVQPAAHFLRWRAGLAPSVLTEESLDNVMPDDDIPLAPDGLARWQITQRLLRLARAGHDPAAILAAEPLRGDLPPKQLGRPVLDQSWRAALAAWRAAAPYEAEPETWHDIDLAWPGLPRLTGQVASRGPVVLTVQPGRLRPGGQLTAWLAVLALRVAEPGTAWRAAIVGPRDRVELPALPADRAGDYLAGALHLHAAASREPLPLPCLTGLWAAPFLARGRSPDPEGLQLSWQREWAADAAWRAVWPEPDELLRRPARPAAAARRSTTPAEPASPAADCPCGGAAAARPAESRPPASPGHRPAESGPATSSGHRPAESGPVAASGHRPASWFEELAGQVYVPLCRAGAIIPRLAKNP